MLLTLVIVYLLVTIAIGLYAAKRLGESMGARLWCEPALPHGARFVVALPAAVAI